MILFSSKLERLKGDAIEYIQKHVMQDREFEVHGLKAWLENNGENQECNVTRVTNEDGEYRVYHDGTLNDSLDYCELDWLYLELLCDIADQIHTSTLKSSK